MSRPAVLSLSAAKVEEELGLRLGRGLDAPALGRVVHDEGDGRVDKGSDGLRRKDEAHEVDGRELPLLLVGVARLELAGDRELLADLDPDGRADVDPHETVEHGLDLLLVGDLDEEGGAELARARHNSVKLVLDLGVVGDALDAAHLLDLEEHGVAVLEDEGQVPAHGHAPHALELDGSLPISARTFSYSKKFRTSFSSGP